MTSLADAAAILASLPKSMDESVSIGAARFFTGTACQNGHIAPRTAGRGRCLECSRGQGARSYAINGEKKRAYHAGRNAENREPRREYAKVWRSANPELARQQSRLRAARKRGAAGTYSLADIEAMAARQKHKCAECRVSIRGGFHADHIMPLVKGGSNWIRNIQLLCAPCNLRKNAKHPIDWARERGLLL